MAAHTRDVNIFFWSSRKSVGHETNDRVIVHGNGRRAAGRRSESGAQISEMWGREMDEARVGNGSGHPM